MHEASRHQHVDPNVRENRSSSVRRSISHGRQPEPLDGVEPAKAAPAPKVKCRSCGCWVALAKPCRLCRTVTLKVPRK
jgi:hypothetical protein